MKDAHTLRLDMVRNQVERRGVRDPRVLRALEHVPREDFVPSRIRHRAYDDAALPIACGQTISQPYVVGRMVEALRLGPGARVLEVGTGSGYAAAVLARIASSVDTVERYAELAEAAAGRLEALGFANVRVHVGDGSLGWPAHAPYDGILVSAGAPDVPPTLVAQLAVGGNLVLPLGRSPYDQDLVRVHRRDDGRPRRARASAPCGSCRSSATRAGAARTRTAPAGSAEGRRPTPCLALPSGQPAWRDAAPPRGRSAGGPGPRLPAHDPCAGGVGVACSVSPATLSSAAEATRGRRGSPSSVVTSRATGASHRGWNDHRAGSSRSTAATTTPAPAATPINAPASPTRRVPTPSTKSPSNGPGEVAEPGDQRDEQPLPRLRRQQGGQDREHAEDRREDPREPELGPFPQRP